MWQKIKSRIPTPIKAGESIYKSLLLYFILFALIPMIVANILYYGFYARTIDDTATRLGKEIIAKASSELNYFFESVTRVGDVAADNPSVQEALRMDFTDNTDLKYSVDLQTDADLYFANFLQPQISGLSILGDNGGEYKSFDRAFLTQDHREQSWYKQIKESNGYVWFAPHRLQFANVSDIRQDSFITCGRPIVDKASGDVTGVLLIDINEQTVRNIISSELGDAGYIFIVDAQSRIIVSSSKMKGHLTNINSIVENEGTTSPIKLSINGKNGTNRQSVVATSYETSVNDWRIIGIIPVRLLNSNGNLLLFLMLLFSSAVIILAILTAIRTSNRVLQPIRVLRNDMNKAASGNLDVITDTGSYYLEVDQLSHSFNMMVEKIRMLMNRTYHDQRKLRKAELEILQSNINPHFLYNTLDSILWLNRFDRQKDVERVIEALTNFFRIGLSRGKDIITLDEERRHLESYLQIQSIRYDNKFTYSIHIDESIKDFYIPKLILQPLAENAIYHGIKLRDGPGSVDTSVVFANGAILIKMRDTGIGMTDDAVRRLNNAMSGNEYPEFQLYGTRNVRDRLRILFGEEINIHYKSVRGEWTEVTISIPDIRLHDLDGNA